MAESRRQKRELKKKADARQRAKRATAVKREAEKLEVVPVASSGELRPNRDAQDKLEETFRSHGIDFSSPGFYDQSKFAAIERRDSRFLESYAMYVHSRLYSPDYLAQVEPKIMRVARFLYETLKADGRRGACIDASLTMSRFLEREGIWNCVIAGGAVLDIPSLTPRYFWPMRAPGNSALTGHAWVCAPPFRVVDITISLQAYPTQYRPHLPEFIAAKHTHETSVIASELYEPEYRAHFFARYGRVPNIRDMETVDPYVLQVAKEFGVFWVEAQRAKVKYIPCQITASDGPLEAIQNFCPSVPSSLVLYERFKHEPV
jgi:hypothetical protein